MKKLVSVLLLFAMVLGMCACGAAPTETTPPTTTEAPEPFVTTTFIENGATTYNIVHDGTMEATEFANNLKRILSANFGVSVEVSMGAAGSEGSNEFVVGNAPCHCGKKPSRSSGPIVTSL